MREITTHSSSRSCLTSGGRIFFKRTNNYRNLFPHLFTIVSFFFLFYFLPCFANESGNAFFIEPGVEDIYQKALEAIKNKEYVAAEGHIRRVLKEDPLYQEEPSGKSAWYWLGIVLEQRGEKLSAVRTMIQGIDSLENANRTDWYINYDLSRMIAENHFEKCTSRITGLMYDMLKNVSPRVQPDLWERIVNEMGFLLGKTDRERLKVVMRKPGSNPGKIFYTFFRQEDPNPITEQNELFARIFQREKKAKEQFTSSSSPSGYDDRGKIYIRLGQPWKIYRDHSGLLGEVGYMIYPYEIWFYKQIHPDIYFTFVRERGTGDFKLVNGPEAVFGTFYKGRRAFFNKLNPGETSAYLHLSVYDELAPFYEPFHERLDQLQEQISPAEAVDYARRNFVPADRDHAASMDTLAPRIAYYTEYVLERLPLNLSMIRFLDRDGQIRVEMCYSIPNEALFFEKDARGWHTSLLGEVGIFDADFNLVASDSIGHFVTGSNPKEREEGVFISQWNVFLQPGDYHLYFRVENPDSKKQAVVKTYFRIDPFPETKLCLSDLQLARDIEPSDKQGLFNKHGLFIKPLVSNIIPIGRSFFVYFEIYHLSMSADSKTNYRVEYQLSRIERKKGFLGLFGGRLSKVQVSGKSIQRTGENSSQEEYRMLVLDDLKKGKYSLRITVVDLNSQTEANREMTIYLIE